MATDRSAQYDYLRHLPRHVLAALVVVVGGVAAMTLSSGISTVSSPGRPSSLWLLASVEGDLLYRTPPLALLAGAVVANASAFRGRTAALLAATGTGLGVLLLGAVVFVGVAVAGPFDHVSPWRSVPAALLTAPVTAALGAAAVALVRSHR